MILPVYIIGSPVLRKVAKDIDTNFPDLHNFIADMFETMYQSDGVGLAAPQVGKSIRLFVVDASPMEDEQPELKDFKRVFINAKIIERFGKEEYFNEGCLSIPGIREDVLRPEKIRMQYLDENFQPHEEVFDGIAARIIQHEYDHLDGILFTDRLSALKRKIIKNKLNAISKGKFSVNYKYRLSLK